MFIYHYSAKWHNAMHSYSKDGFYKSDHQLNTSPRAEQARIEIRIICDPGLDDKFSLESLTLVGTTA